MSNAHRLLPGVGAQERQIVELIYRLVEENLVVEV